MSLLLQFLTGLIFGLGLIVAGMADPAKVLNFLDVAAIASGNWDPSLAFVMAGGILVTFFGFRLVLRRPRPIFAARFSLPTATTVDRRLITGSAVFGLGWGLAGFCPGPGLTALGLGSIQAMVFVALMLIGMAGARWLAAPSRTGGSAARPLLP